MNKTFKIDSVIPGWITISGGQIIRCSQVYMWALHQNYEVLVSWLSRKGNVEFMKI